MKWSWDPLDYVQQALGWMNDTYRRWTDGGTDSWYVGTDGVYYGPMADQVINQKLPGTKPEGYNYGNVGTSNTTAYKANVAGTANKIAQGGMTKDDILKYNIKHPNEIAGDNPANTTALNTNTAVRSK